MTAPHATPAPMDCREFVEIVSEYIEAALAETERLRTEAHLAGCAGCRAYLDQMQRTITLLRRVADGDPEATAHRATLVEVFRAWRASRDTS
ncbi:MAG TPA: zf-HC2 domain-containing protein [Candidatus Limnocylindrales bacterium]|nr:zf-HC2 domain-containing protein [Candidatus Limnocylindrales bacterium]